MKTKNFEIRMPKRMAEVWHWIIALDVWEYGDGEPLAELIKSETIPVEITPAIVEILTGKRKQNKIGASELKIDPRIRMVAAAHFSIIFDLINSMKSDNQADILRKEPIDVINDLSETARKLKDNAAMERFFRIYKSEWMPQECYSTYSDAEYDIAAYMRHYNYRRGHSYNDYLAPALAEAM